MRDRVLVSEQTDEVLAALEPHAGGMLIPTTDYYLELVSRNFEQLSERFIMTTPPWAITSKLMDKRRCYELARSIGLDSPRTFAPATIDELDRLLPELDFERSAYLMTKQLPVGATTDAATRRYTRVGGRDMSTLRERCLEMFERTGELPLIAEVVPGEAGSCFGISIVLNREGEAVASYGVRRLQLRAYTKEEGFVHPYELGANVYCESINDAEALVATCSLLRAAHYYGTATVEFRRDPRDRRIKLIKVDPRFVRATSLSLPLGVDLPRALYLAFTGQPTPTPVEYPDGRAWIWVTAGAAKHTRAILRNRRNITAAAFLGADDPLPFLIDLVAWSWANLKRLLNTLLRRK
jgi:predicted ATP-grasp superfamily ATP-dependent carboligase